MEIKLLKSQNGKITYLNPDLLVKAKLSGSLFPPEIAKSSFFLFLGIPKFNLFPKFHKPRFPFDI
jgi:hypothetical protein